MNVVAPFGFYGSGNIGDEATLQGFAELLRRHPHRMRVWVASQNPRHTARVEPALRYYRYHLGRRRYLTAWIRRFAKAYVFPGGTPIMDGLGDWPLCELIPMVSQARRRGKPVVFVGTGTESLQRSESRLLVRQTLANYVAHWSVRSARDRNRLSALGVDPARVTVAADLAWLLKPVSGAFGQQILQQPVLGDQRLIGVNINGERAMLEREPRLFEKLAGLLDILIEAHRARVVFLYNEIRDDATFDRAAAAMIRARMRNADKTAALDNEYWAPQQMMSVIAGCSLTISSRYHFCLFSALLGIPFLAIKRSDKVADLCEDLDWPFGAAPGAIDAQELAGHGALLLEGRVAQMQHLENKVAVMSKRALRNLIAVDAIHSFANAVPGGVPQRDAADP